MLLREYSGEYNESIIQEVDYSIVNYDLLRDSLDDWKKKYLQQYKSSIILVDSIWG